VDEMVERVQALEQRVAALESQASRRSADPRNTDPADEAPASTPGRVSSFEERFWALTGLKDRLADGGVLFTGSVALPEGPIEWQLTTPTTELVDSDWSEFADTLAALGHPVRLRLLQAITAGTHASAQLQELPGLGTSGQIYHHLRALTQAGWLRAGARGQWAVPPERVVPLLVVLAAARR
jgi:hypothetical protein